MQADQHYFLGVLNNTQDEMSDEMSEDGGCKVRQLLERMMEMI